MTSDFYQLFTMSDTSIPSGEASVGYSVALTVTGIAEPLWFHVVPRGNLSV